MSTSFARAGRAPALGLLHVLLVADGAFACSPAPESDPTPAACVSENAQAIFGGRRPASLKDLSPDPARSVGAIETPNGTAFCTGVVVGPGRLLTAAHCTDLDESMLRLSPGGGEEDLVLPLGVAATTDDADLAVVALPGWSEASELVARPLSLWTTPLDPGVRPGTTAWLAGTGVTEDGARGELRMVQETIAKLTADLISVDGSGRSGACSGDSGGPLLLDDASGDLRVLGVLRDGSDSCTGVDRYTRLDVHATWLERALGMAGGGVCQ